MDDTWFLMPNWKWLAFVGALVVGFFLLHILRPLLANLQKRLKSRFHEESWLSAFLSQEIHRPLSMILVSLLWLEAWEAIALPNRLARIATLLTQILMSLGILRLAYLGVDAFGHVMSSYSRKTTQAFDNQLIPFATKALKILVIVLGFLIVMQNFGINVVSLLAGLGIGGLALALAAQDTAANVFGSITILLDRPFKVGDWVKIGDVEGVVEEVGFRSTRVRTFYKSLITLPNAMVAKEKIDNFELRVTRRFRHTIGLAYQARRDQVESFVEHVRYMLNQHPNVDSSGIGVNVNAMGDSSIQILVNCFLKVKDSDEEALVQQELLLNLRDMTASVGASFAYPSQTLYHVLPPPPAQTVRPQQNTTTN